MKTLLCSLLLTLSMAAAAQADIQAPPASNQGPTRKLGRGFSNLICAITDWQQAIAEANDQDGNSAIATGFVRGAGRFAARTSTGLFDIADVPFPVEQRQVHAPFA